MRTVLDTNVLVSGLMTAHGTCGRIIDLLFDGLLDTGVDDRILAEYDDVLHRPELRIDPEDAAEVLEFIRATALLVPAVPLSVKLPDPDDLPFLEVASAAQAVLVTGNIRHLPKRARKGVAVMSPAEFLDLVRRAD